MVFKKSLHPCYVLWMKVASALEGLKAMSAKYMLTSRIHTIEDILIQHLILIAIYFFSG